MLTPDNSSIYNLVKKDGYYTIVDVNNDNLIFNSRNILTFQADTNATETANLFIISISYVLV